MAETRNNKWFNVLLYPESVSYDIEIVLNRIKSFSQSYAYCLHNLDIDETGELKKAHIHCVLSKSYAASPDKIAKQLGIPDNFVRPCHDYRESVCYLIHLNNPEKYQYSIDDIVSNFSLSSCFGSYQEWQIVDSIINYVYNNRSCTLYDVLQYVNKNGFYATYRRNYSIIKDLIFDLKRS